MLNDGLYLKSCLRLQEDELYYTGLYIYNLDEKGRCSYKNLPYKPIIRTQNIYDIIDKSGYLVDKYRYELKQRLEEYKLIKNKQKAAQQ